MLCGRISISKRLLPSCSRLLSSMSKGAHPVAVVLSGCGVYDGSEIHEASAVMVHLSRSSAKYQLFAPDIDQMHVVNHMSGQEETGVKRNVLTESARIARGNIKPLSQLNVDEYSAVVFPGGFGAAKNLCDFAVKQADCVASDDVKKTLQDFHALKKPIGLCCIAPVLAARVIKGCTITLGMDDDKDGRWPYFGSVQAATAMGASHVNKDVNEIVIDDSNNIITTPAFMCNAELHEIHDGVGRMIIALLDRLN